jgi:colanic acid biosynthesis glycosyl transferase WcaI
MRVRSRRILICSSYYWPEESGNAPYVTGLAEYLAARGHDVCVATGFPHYPSWSSSEVRLIQKEQRNGVTIRRRAHYVPRRQSALHRALYEGSLAVGGLTALPVARRPDLVIAEMPTLAAGALALGAAALSRARLAVIFQDLQGRAAAQSGIPGGDAVARVVGRAELLIARRAAMVGVIAEGFRDFLEAGGVRSDRIHRVRNWSTYAEPKELVEETRERLGWGQDEFVCLHAGNMGRKQGLENVLEAAALTTNAGVRFVLAGDGNERATLEALVTARRLRNVQFLGIQPSGGPFDAMCRAADVLLVNQRGAVRDMSLPSKLTTYFSAGRPVIAAVHERSETAAEVMRSNGGRIVPADRPVALAAAIARIASDPMGRATFGAAARVYAAETLSRDATLARIESLLLSATPVPHGPMATSDQLLETR